MLTQQESEAVMTVCLMAAFADGDRSAEERKRIDQIGRDLGMENYSTLLQKVILKSITLEECIAPLATDEGKRLAYEMAVYVCDADGPTKAEEQDFLHRLGPLLGLHANQAAEVQEIATAVAATSREPEPEPLAVEPKDTEVDAMITKYAVLTAALELLPQSIATMAIIPLQMKMVYRIGKNNGVALDQGHIKEFLATVGIGLTAQMVEGLARRLLGQVGRRVGGRLVGHAIDAATGAGMTFASTYALGKVAKLYYAQGRRIDSNQLREIFSQLLAEGKSLFVRHQADVVQQSRTLSLSEFIPLLGKR